MGEWTPSRCHATVRPNIQQSLAGIALVCLSTLAAATDALGPVDFYRSERAPVSLAYFPGTVVFAGVKGKDFAAEEMLAIIETRLTQRTAAGAVETKRQQVIALCGRGLMRIVDSDGKPPPADAYSFEKFAPAEDPRMERFRLALCGGELRGVPPPSAERRSGWIQYLEGDKQALYAAVGGTSELPSRHTAVRVRLYELGGAVLEDGRHVDGREAVWVLDCSAKTGGVAYERLFERAGSAAKTVATLGSADTWARLAGIDVSTLKFSAPTPGSIQAYFSDFACANRPTPAK